MSYPPGTYPDDYEPRRDRSRSYRLDPHTRVSYGGGLYRSGSRGHGNEPANINIYTTNNNDAYQEGPYQDAREQGPPRGRMAQQAPPYGYAYPVAQQAAPALMPQAAPNIVPVYIDRPRSKSRRSSGSRSPRRIAYEDEDYRRRIIADQKRKDDEEKEERKRALQAFQLDQARKDQEEKEEKKRAIQAYKLDQEKREQEEKEERDRAVEAYKRKQREEKERREKEHEEWLLEQERREREEEEEEEAAVRRHKEREEAEAEKAKKAWEAYEQKKKAEAEKKKEAEKAAWEAYERKRKDDEEKKKASEKKADDEYKERMRKHLAKIGYAPNQIDTIVEMESLKINSTPGTMMVSPRNNANGRVVPGVTSQVFPKLRRQDIAEETLKHFKLDWEYLREDPNYIIILQELTERETDILFTHTERLREKSGGTTVLQIEAREHKGKEPELLLVRRKSKSGGGGRSRSKSRDRSQTRGARFAAGVLGI